MYNINLYKSKVTPSILLYGKLNQLDSLIGNNISAMLSYQLRVGWIYKSQNILVKFLNDFRISTEWDDEFIYNYIKATCDRSASKFDMVTVWNKGKNNRDSLFKEHNHNVLFVLPKDCGIKDVNFYMNTPLERLEALTTLYTTDVNIRYDGATIANGQKTLDSNGDYYTIVQIDPFALVFGYLRYLKISQDNGRLIIPENYISMFPLVNFYKQHNLMVMLNYLNGNISDLKIEKTNFTLIDLKDKIKDYILFQEGTLLNSRFKDFSAFINQVNQLPNYKELLDKSIFPDTFNSKHYTQMGWVYNFGSIAIINKYLYYRKFYGIPDTDLNGRLDNWFKIGLNGLSVNITDNLWKKHFIDLYKDLEGYYK